MNTTTPSKASSASVERTKATPRAGSGSPLSARGSVRRPGQAPRSESSGGAEESKAEATALVDDLKEQLRKAEIASEEYQKQAAVLQARLDDALNDHTKMEESSHETITRLEQLEHERQESSKRYRDLETAFENDKVSSMREKEEAMLREQELTDTVQRLKDTISNRDKRASIDGEGLLTRATSIRGRSSPHNGAESPAAVTRDSSQNNSKLVLQKDKVIESLRLELAEAQIKLVELENAGGGHSRELEKMLLEARMSNAKLMEDNESYQVLLSEKTLNGDFGKSSFLDPGQNRSGSEPPKTPTLGPVSGSLADELEDSANDPDDERVRKLESELTAQKDQNKALTLYINKIITRLLQNETFEQLFENGSITGDNPLKNAPEPSVPAPKEKAEEINLESAKREAAASPPPEQNKENAAPSFLQRAGSIFGGRQRGRPKSLIPPQQGDAAPAKQPTPTANVIPSSPPSQGVVPSSHHLSIPNENPDSAPSIPLRRSASGRGHARVPSMRSSHRRATSEWSGAANIVNNMHRTPSGGNGLSSPTGLASPRQTSGSFFPAQTGLAPPLILENTEQEDGDASNNQRSDIASDSGYGESVMSRAASEMEAPSSPRAAAAAALEGKPLPAAPHPPPSLNRSDTAQSNESKQATASSGPAAWFQNATSGAGSKTSDAKPGMRPLRLVQEKAEADEAAAAERKKANRTSFMGWFNKGQGAAPPSAASPPQAAAGLSSPPPPMGMGLGHGRQSIDRPGSGGSMERSPPRG